MPSSAAHFTQTGRIFLYTLAQVASDSPRSGEEFYPIRYTGLPSVQGAGCPRRAFSFFLIFDFYTLCPMKETEDRLGVLALLLCARWWRGSGHGEKGLWTPTGLGSLSNWRPILVVSTIPFALVAVTRSTLLAGAT